MIVLTTSTSAQTFSFIPRDVFDTMILTDDQTNTPVTVAITSSTQGDYINTITASFALKEGHFYDLVLKQGTASVCTIIIYPSISLTLFDGRSGVGR